MKQSVLILQQLYLPGFRGGGPTRSIYGLVESLGDELDFRIIAADRDFLDTKPYSDILRRSWNVVGKASVFYMKMDLRAPLTLLRLLRSTSHDVLYLNSFCNKWFSIYPLLLRRFGLIPKCGCILAPRGEFGLGAWHIKRRRKMFYLDLAIRLRLLDGVILQASSVQEKTEILQRLRPHWRGIKPPVLIAAVMVATDIPKINVQNATRPRKKAGELNMCVIARITKMKNFLFALKIVSKLRGKVEFTIYGPCEDQALWAKCQLIIMTMPKNLSVRYLGELANNRVNDVLSHYHAFFMPTLGENFSHSIAEALLCGCPIVISDQTPWHGLREAGAGWDLPLENEQAFVDALQHLVDLDQDGYSRMCESASIYIQDMFEKWGLKAANLKLFETAAQHQQIRTGA